MNTTQNKEREINNIIIKMIVEIEKYNDTYLDTSNLLKDINLLINKYSLGKINRCIECNIDMGPCNLRQLCGKYKCDTIFL